jgi:hypothetical protein
MALGPLSSTRVRLLTLCVFGLAACGGGGGGGGGGGSGSPPPPPTLPTIKLSTNSVSETGTTTNDVAPIATIQVSFSSVPAAAPYFKATFTGTAVAGYGASSDTTSGVTLLVALWQPASLGAGTYTDTLTVSICVDSACATQYPGSPAKVAVKYVVTGSAALTPTFQLEPTATNFTATTTGAAPTAGWIVNVDNIPPKGLWTRWNWPSTGIVGNVTFQQSLCAVNCSNNGWGTYTVTMGSPAKLGSGIYNSSVTVEMCYDQACTSQLSGSPVTIPVQYTVSATAGSEYAVTTVQLNGAADVAYDSQNQMLYAIVLTGAPKYANSIVAINPTTGAVGSSLTLPGNPERLSITSDGSYAYVSLPALGTVQRVALPGLTMDISIPMGVDSNNQPLVAGRMAPAPAAPHTLAVAFKSKLGDAAGGVTLFDDAVARTNAISPLNSNEIENSIAWGNDSTTLYLLRYAYPPLLDNFDTVAVSSSGLSITSVDANVTFNAGYQQYSDIFYASGFIYTNDGTVFNVGTSTVAGAYRGQSTYTTLTLVPDATLGKTFVLYHDASTSDLMLLSFNLSTFAFEGLANLGYDSTGPDVHLIRWGANGLAFVSNGSSVIILSGAFIGT